MVLLFRNIRNAYTSANGPEIDQIDDKGFTNDQSTACYQKRQANDLGSTQLIPGSNNQLTRQPADVVPTKPISREPGTRSLLPTDQNDSTKVRHI